MSVASTDRPAAFEEAFAAALQRYAGDPLFSDNLDPVLPNHPYRRPVRPQDLGALEFDTPMTRQQALDYTSLAANRIAGACVRGLMLGPLRAHRPACVDSR